MKLAIVTPMFDGKTHHEFTESLAETIASSARFEQVKWHKLAGCADVSLARNTLLARVRSSEADACLWIDADMGWNPEAVELVLGPLLDGTGDVVTGLYPKKQPGLPSYTVALFPGDVDEERGYVGPVRMVGKARYGRVLSAGGGFLAMSRQAMEKGCEEAPKYCPWAGHSLTGTLTERHARLFFPNIHDETLQGIPRYFGEDSGASEALRKAGVEILFSFDAELSHHEGGFSFGGEKPDVHGFARRLALANDMMRAAAKGKPIDEATYQKRAQAILRR